MSGFSGSTSIPPGPNTFGVLCGGGTSFAGKAFLKSYIGVCMEGVVIVLARLVFSAFMSGSNVTLDTSLSAATMSWQYVGETIFNMLVLVAWSKASSALCGIL